VFSVIDSPFPRGPLPGCLAHLTEKVLVFAVPPNTVATAAPLTAAHLTAAHPVRLALEYARDRRRWAHLLRYDPDSRWFTRIEQAEAHEVWLMSWLPGQATGLHDHGGATGAFTVVSGVLDERVVRADGRAEALHTVHPGQSRVFGPNYVHQVRNDGPDPAVSVHVYRAARVPMRRYQVDPVTGLSEVD
jgi:predicted metal-dependent enzyme (double-stranded beta helix superfamily)